MCFLLILFLNIFLDHMNCKSIMKIFSNQIFRSLWQFPDAYAQTKAEAEKLVMKANGTNDLLTCCIRPSSIFGPGDMILPTLDRYGQTQVRK